MALGESSHNLNGMRLIREKCADILTETYRREVLQVDILKQVRQLATEMAEQAKQEQDKVTSFTKKRVKNEKKYIEQLNILYDEWRTVGGREPSHWTSSLEPYTSVGATYMARPLKGEWQA